MNLKRGFWCGLHDFKLWGMIDSFVIFKQKPLEFIKLVEIACVQVLGFVEDECWFLIVVFMKNVKTFGEP
jgi:hypothetical protein